MITQLEALRIAEQLEAYWGLYHAAAKLRRLHTELDDYKKTCDELIRSSCNDQAEIVKLEDQRDELLEVLAMAEPVMDAYAGPSRLADFRAAIAKATGEVA